MNKIIGTFDREDTFGFTNERCPFLNDIHGNNIIYKENALSA